MSCPLISMEPLIKEVHKRPCIWNIRNSGYNDKQIKMKAWQNICRIFYPETVEGSADESSKIVYIQKRWKSVRDYYTKQKRETQADALPSSEKRRKYIYFDLLRFLEANSGSNGAVDDLGSPSAKQEREMIQEDSLDISENSSEAGTAKTDEDDFFDTDVGTSTGPKNQDIDEDEMFLLSLLPSIRKLTPLQKMDFKLEVMGALKNIQFSKNPSQ